METKSYYVETGPMQNTQLDRGVRFATKAEAEEALSTLLSFRQVRGAGPAVCESCEPPTTTIAAWNQGGW